MNESALRSEGLFDHGPFPHFQRSLGLFRPVGSDVLPRAICTVLLGWLPLVILVLAQDLSGQGSKFYSFLTDLGVHTRSLLAVPLFIIVERFCLPRLNQVAQHFVGSGLVTAENRISFHNLILTTRARMNSTAAEVIVIALAYIVAILLRRFLVPESMPEWYWVQTNSVTLSWAGWWYLLISLPLLLIVVFGWLWRVLLWTRFLFFVSKMPLRYIAAHPDHAAGLKFLNASLLGFMPVAFTIGVIVAGSVANKIQLHKISIDTVQTTVLALVLVVVILFAGPLMIFIFKLYRVKTQGIFWYDQLASFVGQRFEEKWLTGYQKTGQHSLEVPDFSATTDLYSVVANVHASTALPFEWRALLGLVLSALLPFLPVVLMTIPIKVIIKELASLLL